MATASASPINGLSLGLFAGDLQFTVYKGSNLLRQEALAKTDAPTVAYIYKAGLKGFGIADDTKLIWRDTSQVWQQDEFGGATNQQPINLSARNRLEISRSASAPKPRFTGRFSAAAQVLFRARK